jgi:hypothetical protein
VVAGTPAMAGLLVMFIAGQLLLLGRIGVKMLILGSAIHLSGDLGHLPPGSTDV